MPDSALATQFTLDQPDFTRLSPAARLHWAQDRYGDALAATSSFGVHSVLLIDQMHKAGLLQSVPIVTVDIAGEGWSDQRAYRDRLQRLYGFDLRVFQATDEDDKTRTLEEGLKSLGVRATLDGIRFQQTENRGDKPFLEFRKDGRMAIHPLLDWPEAKADWHIENKIAATAHHPDWVPGARSTGGVILATGAQKTECGLHL